tara:strand:- start:2688 stop:2909 length:222 start_codon:yes stop_codon:yes gene_type:complete
MLEHIKPQQQDKKIKKTTEQKILQVANLSPDESAIEKIVEIHPMRQIAIMSVVQVCMLAFMGVSMLLIGLVFK